MAPMESCNCSSFRDYPTASPIGGQGQGRQGIGCDHHLPETRPHKPCSSGRHPCFEQSAQHTRLKQNGSSAQALTGKDKLKLGEGAQTLPLPIIANTKNKWWLTQLAIVIVGRKKTLATSKLPMKAS